MSQVASLVLDSNEIFYLWVILPDIFKYKY